ncbi:baculoviral IAP repeat-containing protein 5-like [Folsomia candida]|uniref:baculoviral IAP repeat-containing protein 5-like n=1 Tax=Folsomia candida TaxID=158441 RepID=UPI001605194F|nr:baculoviral IAP repeat-containing protein 5-like [Folsomia candida]
MVLQDETFPTLVYKPYDIDNKDMCLNSDRVATFKNWTGKCKQNPKNFSEAGFYSTGYGDRLSCYYCGIIIHNWLPSDDPWIEHSIHSSDCPFLSLHKPKLQTILSKDLDQSYTYQKYNSLCKQINSSKDENGENQENATLTLLHSLMETFLCSVCKLEEANYMFHVVTFAPAFHALLPKTYVLFVDAKLRE